MQLIFIPLMFMKDPTQVTFLLRVIKESDITLLVTKMKMELYIVLTRLANRTVSIEQITMAHIGTLTALMVITLMG